MKATGRAFTGAAVLLALFLGSCALSPSLRTSPAQPGDVTGTYSLILYGGRYSTDIENVAILAKEGTGYSFAVYAPDFDYKVKKNLPAREALEAAQQFVSFHYAFRSSQLSTIADGNGAILGYELRPLYSPLDFGYADVLDITYTLGENKVTVMIRLIPELDRPPLRDISPFRFRME